MTTTINAHANETRLNVIVDTSVWSFGLKREERRLNPDRQGAVKELKELIGESRVRLIGFVRQEIRSGVKAAAQFEELRTFFRAFPDVPLETSDYAAAAEASNTWRSEGVTVSIVDALVASTAIVRGWSVFTLDADFERLSRILRQNSTWFVTEMHMELRDRPLALVRITLIPVNYPVFQPHLFLQACADS